MFKPLKRPNCRFIAGDAAYIGKTGLIIDKIDKHFRIILDQPQGEITEGRWLVLGDSTAGAGRGILCVGFCVGFFPRLGLGQRAWGGDVGRSPPTGV